MSVAGSNAVAFGSRLFLLSEGGQLWSSDGSIAGSAPVSVGMPGRTEWYTATSRGVLFVTRKGEDFALWRTDGTEAGTALVSRLPTATSTSQQVGQSDTTVWFNLGPMLWKTDGTTEGTALVRDFTAEGAIGTGRALPANGRFIFTVAKSQLWSTDGTPEGTVRLNRYASSAGGDPLIKPFLLAGDSLVFFGCTLDLGCEPWRTDGTAPGTWLLKDTLPTAQMAYDGMVGEARGLAYFDTRTGSGTSILWRTDGTPEGTFPLPAETDTQLVLTGNQVFLVGYSAVWKTDGTPEGTQVVDPGGPFTIAGMLGERMVYVDRALASHQVRTLLPEGAPEVVTDVPAAQVVGVVPSGSLVLADRQMLEDSLYSVRLDTGERQSLPIPLREGGTYPWRLVPGEGRLLFQLGEQVWESQGTPESIRFLAEGRRQPCASCYKPPQARALGNANGITFYTTGDWLHALPRDAREPVALVKGTVFPAVEQGGRLLFLLVPSQSPQELELWASDGTVEGTVRLAPLLSGFETTQRISAFARAGQRRYFTVESYDLRSSQLWVTDGTAEGTRALRRFARTRLEPGGGLPGGALVFGCSDAAAPRWEPCVSDGTEAGTHPLPGWPEGSNPEGFTAFQGAVYFNVDDGVHGRELWRSGGTAESTRLVKDFIPGAHHGQPEAFVVSSAGLFFRASTQKEGAELWRMNAMGVLQRLTDSLPGPHSGMPRGLLALEPEGVVLFTARSPEHGEELWLSDGTEKGTRLLVDLVPSFLSGEPAELARVDNHVYFSGRHPEHGRVLWMMPLEP
jgi:ELWxxDGT repeat protein